MKFAIVALLVVFAAAQAVENRFVCNICVDLVSTLKEVVETKGSAAVKGYIDDLCGKASGLVGVLCNRILDFGVDKLVALIESRVDASSVCAKIGAC